MASRTLGEQDRGLPRNAEPGIRTAALRYLTEVDAAHLDAALSALANGENSIEARTGLAHEAALQSGCAPTCIRPR